MMWKFVFLVVLPVLATTKSLLIVPRDEIVESYKTERGRNFLTPEQEEFLMELLAADDAIIEATSRGIVDDILQALSGTGSNIRVNVVGGSGFQTQNRPAASPASASASAQQPAVNIINPTFTINGGNLGNSSLNSTTTDAIVSMVVTAALAQAQSTQSSDKPLADISSSSISAATAPKQAIPGSATGTGTVSQGQSNNVTTIGGTNNHLFQTISSVIRNSNARNVTGIVDESLRIATPAPIREFVTGILNVVYCNGIRRLLGRC